MKSSSLSVEEYVERTVKLTTHNVCALKCIKEQNCHSNQMLLETQTGLSLYVICLKPTSAKLTDPRNSRRDNENIRRYVSFAQNLSELHDMNTLPFSNDISQFDY